MDSASAAAPTNTTDLTTTANEVLAALRDHDLRHLAALAHPTKGVRFSPYVYVQPDSDVVLTRSQIAEAWTDTTRRVWGEFDGSGEPIRLTFPEYYRRFIYNADFAEAPRQSIDSVPIKHGNTPSNLKDVYPNARWVERHFPGFDPKYEGMDWTSLWLVFEPHDRGWYLVGIVHGSWTI